MPNLEGSPELQPTAEPIPVDGRWLAMAQAGEVPYVDREQPRPPGGSGGSGYGSDVGSGETFFEKGM